MWLFSKRKGINDIARDDEEDDICKDTLPSFAPQIISDKAKKFEVEEDEKDLLKEKKKERKAEFADFSKNETEDSEFSKELPSEDFDMPLSEEDFSSDYETKEIEKEEEPREPEELTREEECYDLDEDLPDPTDIYNRLKDLPYCGRYYALKDDRLLLLHPDDAGNLYLFEEYGDYSIVVPQSCKAFIHIKGLRAYFKGKYYTTTDFEYILREKAWPLLVLARNKEQYKIALKDGYTVYKESPDKKGIILAKPIALYRMKELSVKTEIAFCSVVSESDDYQIDVDYKVINGIECDKDFKKFCKSLIDTVEHYENVPFFTLQVLKNAGNIAVAFPLEGNPEVGDLFADGRITEMASGKDGTVILMVGHDKNTVLPLKINQSYLGQHALTLEES